MLDKCRFIASVNALYGFPDDFWLLRKFSLPLAILVGLEEIPAAAVPVELDNDIDDLYNLVYKTLQAALDDDVEASLP